MSFIDLELNEAQARGLICLSFCLPDKEDIIFTVAFLAVDTVNQSREFLEVGRIAVDELLAAVVPPVDTGLTVFHQIGLPFHIEVEFGTEFLTGDTVVLEYVEQVSRCEGELLVQEVCNTTFLFS